MLKVKPHLSENLYLIVLSWLLLILFCILQFTLQGAVGLMSVQLKQEFSLDASALGILSSSLFYATSVIQLPGGFSYDKFGVRNVVVLSMLTLASGCFLFALSDVYILAIAGRICMGFGSGMAFLGLLAATHSWAKKNEFALYITIAEALIMLGVAICTPVLSWMSQDYGWRIAMNLCGGTSVILGFLTYLIFPKLQNNLANKTKSGSQMSPNKFLECLKSPALWLVSIACGSSFIPVTVYASLWAIPYLRTACSLDSVSASSVAAMIFVGIGTGCPLLGFLNKKISGSALMLTGTLMTLVFMSLILFSEDLSLITYFILHFFLGFFCSNYQLAFPLICQYVPSEISNLAMSFVNMFTIIMAVILQPLAGFILSAFEQASDGQAEVYSADQYRYALALIPFFLGVASVCIQILRTKTNPCLETREAAI